MSVAPLDRILVTSRDFDEYLLMFGLDEHEVLGTSVLDCPGGASDFTAAVCARGGTAVSADPLYAAGPDEVGAVVSAHLDRAVARAAEAAAMYDLGWAGGVDGYVARRRRASARFLADFTADRSGGGGRYVAAALPALPFADHTFGLTLVPNLLFTYANLFDGRWHLAALRELMRVSAEVRVHPLADSSGTPYPLLAALREELALVDGIDSEVRASAYRLHRYPDATLICRRGEAG
ncbi:hypothetical protein [Lentzea terrae]|uniref:hypothetical protein n=1 Tax=Lentzea terrae TaxID=2200761 RepID=UPI000DD45DD5|nr:hypothetical protein [Lentzea terrae]